MSRGVLARPRGTTRQRVISGWAIAALWTTYGTVSWPAHPEWPTWQHLLHMVPALLCMSIALRRTLNRRRQLAGEAAGQK